MRLAGTNSLSSSSAPMFSQTPRATIIPPRQFPLPLFLSPRFLLFLLCRDPSSTQTRPPRRQLPHPLNAASLHAAYKVCFSATLATCIQT
ncbi:hypothetical protein DVH24_032618 [Malus domestica]|uniref:Uncharacterized protein n=1 Tax=Malus domestica TaxID=3750 RepID=A0A498JA44_MALDO|nr:hypothetical protein DVH24_032618 [Malus domestica]